MKSNILTPNQDNYKIASECIKNGGVIVSPSDTNLALTLDPWNVSAINRDFAIKNRPANAALTLFFLEPRDWREYAIALNEDLVDKLVEKFWPGPLNLILAAKQNVPQKMLCGGTTVSMGCLSNPTWRGLMAEHKEPVTMTSANLSGQAEGMLVDMDIVQSQVRQEVDYILEGGAQGTTTSSTILDLTQEIPTIIRLGDITAQDITLTIGIEPIIRLAK